jgi:hypothetical protein
MRLRVDDRLRLIGDAAARATAPIRARRRHAVANSIDSPLAVSWPTRMPSIASSVEGQDVKTLAPPYAQCPEMALIEREHVRNGVALCQHDD